MAGHCRHQLRLLDHHGSRQGQRILAQQLKLLNRQRQDETLALVNLVKAKIGQSGAERYLYVAAWRGYRRGIVGLAAGRVAEELYRPVAVAEIAGDRVIGSARSIPEFDITTALDSCKEADDGMLIRYGGHAMAAGFTAPVDRLPALTEHLEALAHDGWGGKELAPALDIETPKWAWTSWITPPRSCWRNSSRCGRGNPQPVLASRGLEVCECRLVGRDEQHLKLAVRDPRATGARSGQVWPAIAFPARRMVRAPEDACPRRPGLRPRGGRIQRGHWLGLLIQIGTDCAGHLQTAAWSQDFGRNAELTSTDQSSMSDSAILHKPSQEIGQPLVGQQPGFDCSEIM